MDIPFLVHAHMQLATINSSYTQVTERMSFLYTSNGEYVARQANYPSFIPQSLPGKKNIIFHIINSINTIKMSMFSIKV